MNNDLMTYLDRERRRRRPDALEVQPEVAQELLKAARVAVRSDPSFSPSLLAADVMLHRTSNWDFARAIRARYEDPRRDAAEVWQELQGYVDSVAMFVALTGSPSAASADALLRVLDRSPYFNNDENLTPRLRENARSFVRTRGDSAIDRATGDEFLLPDGPMTRWVEEAAIEGRPMSYQRGMRTSRDTLLLLKDLIDTFLIGGA